MPPSQVMGYDIFHCIKQNSHTTREVEEGWHDGWIKFVLIKWVLSKLSVCIAACLRSESVLVFLDQLF